MAQPDIPIELYPNIVQFIPITDGSTHISLSVVSKSFHYAAERGLYREIRLHFRNAEAFSSLLSSLLKPGDGGLCRASYVRELHILRGRDGPSLTPVMDAIKHLTNLRELHWNCPPTQGDVEALFNHGQWPFQLERLAWCRRSATDSLDATDGLTFSTFLGAQQRLTHLSVLGFRGEFHPPLLPTIQWLEADDHCSSFIPRCQNVVHLTLTSEGNRTHASPLPPLFRRLKSFTIDCHDVGYDRIEHFLPSLENLNRLCLRYHQHSSTKIARKLSSLDISTIPSSSLQCIRIIVVKPHPEVRLHPTDYEEVIGLQATVWLQGRPTLEVVEYGVRNEFWVEAVTKRFFRSTDEAPSEYLNDDLDWQSYRAD
jgi:hypothetical protein